VACKKGETYEDGTERVFLSVDIQNSDTRESFRRKHTASRTWRESEIKKYLLTLI
jgi:hypothetical protein